MLLRLLPRVILGTAILAIVAYSVIFVRELGGVRVPRPPHIAERDVIQLYEKQGSDTSGNKKTWKHGWEPGDTQWFRHASQGTRILPYLWFIHLEQPSIGWPGKLSDPAYLARFGFLRSETEDGYGYNPDGLPIGFAIEDNFEAPYARPPSPPRAEPKDRRRVVGLTCAACHTGQVSWRQDGMLKAAVIEGGSAMINLAAFQEAVGRALAYTLMIGPRFERFAGEVLRKQATPDAKVSLRRELEQYLEVGMATKEYQRVHKLNGTEAGFARTDALGLIGNRVFGVIENENLIVADAPVNFPPLWNTPWFSWVQYNASIRLPLARNIGEALGVGAPVDVKADDPASTVNMRNLGLIEDQLGGDDELEGLQSPRWKDAGLPPADPPRIEKGRGLYTKYCQRCHFPPIDELKKAARDGDFDTHFWEKDDESGKYFLNLHNCDLREIGTDPNQAMNLYRRVVVLHGKTIPATLGLFTITDSIRRKKEKALSDQGMSEDEIRALRRYRSSPVYDAEGRDRMADPVVKDVLRANLRYKARPLNGIWATPPYLHNGSVPNLYQLLLPVGSRDRSFYLGTTLFDVKRVGYQTEEFPGGFLLDTTLPGNSNSGHEFRNLTLEELENVPDPPLMSDGMTRSRRLARALDVPVDQVDGLSEEDRWKKFRDATLKALGKERVRRDHPFKGVLGPELSEKERWDLVEYLKTL